MLDNISFEIEKGSFTGVIGPNGSGKTTLFKGLTGELKIQASEMVLNQTDYFSINLRQKAQRLAIVTQNTEVTDITVEDYVLMGRIPYRSNFQFFESQQDYDIAHKYMNLTNVYRFKDKLMSELSGGEQQLAAIARALTQEPELLLLDEATSHLDIMHQVEILNLIQQLNEELNLTVLMIIHDLNLASEYCDYLVMMNKGGIYTKGKPEDVLNYQNIEQVYKTVVYTRENPMSKKPAIFLVSRKVQDRVKKQV